MLEKASNNLNYFTFPLLTLSVSGVWPDCMPYLLGATSIEKNPKNFSFWPKLFWPPPPLFEKGLYRRKRRYFVPNNNYKIQFFQNFIPPISPESQTSLIFTIETTHPPLTFNQVYTSLHKSYINIWYIF